MVSNIKNTIVCTQYSRDNVSENKELNGRVYENEKSIHKKDVGSLFTQVSFKI